MRLGHQHGVFVQGTADVPQELPSEKGADVQDQCPGAEVAPSIKDGAGSSRMKASVAACPPGPPPQGRYMPGSQP